MPQSREGYLSTPTSRQSGLSTAAVVPSTAHLKSSYDVIVIGAGFAGLTAARDLARDSGLDVLLLDARDRIGGRTWTATALGEEFEMGGGWVHWCQPHVYAALRRYRLHRDFKVTAGTADIQKMFYKSPQDEVAKPIDPEVDTEVAGAMRDFFEIDGLSARELMPFPHDPFKGAPQPWERYDHLSVRDRLEQMEFRPFLRGIMEGHLQIMGCESVDKVPFVEALRWYALGGYEYQMLYDAAGVFKFGKGGMTRFAGMILEEFGGDLALETVVKSVEQTDGQVTLGVETGSGPRQIQAKYAVCTIPLNCLPDVEFDPPLQGPRMEAAKAGHINKGAKIHFKVSQTEPGFFSESSDPIKSDLIMAYSEHNGTVGEPSGTYAVGFGYSGHLDLRDFQDHDRILAGMKQLCPHLDVEAYLLHDWANDPYAKGSWFCARPGMTSKYLRALQENHGRVFMASGDWADGWRGFVDGAIERGTDAAVDIAAALKAESA